MTPRPNPNQSRLNPSPDRLTPARLAPARLTPARLSTDGLSADHRRAGHDFIGVDGLGGLDGLGAVDGVDRVRVPGDFLSHLLDQTAGSISAEQARQLAADLADLQRWLESLPVIEQAKGILMDRYQIDAEAAFNVLRRWSNHHNIKIRTISEQLTAAVSHHNPTDDTRTTSALDDVIAIFDRPASRFTPDPDADSGADTGAGNTI